VTGVAAPTGSLSGSVPGDPAAGGSLVVYVSGRVRHPGVVSLASGSRVQDALKAAGGALPRSDLTSINLAQLLADGEQILVAKMGAGSSVSAGSPGAGSGGGTRGDRSGGTVVDINTSDATALDSLPGVGPVLAQRIVDWRMAHGRFTSVDELDEVTGIGDKLMAEIRPHVRV
jgi:comEA protein